MLLRTCKLLSIQQSKKAMFPNVFLKTSSVTQILHLYARSSFFGCGLFPSRASISVMVWGVIWDKICNVEGRMAVSFKYYLWHWSKVGCLLVQTTVAQAELLMWVEKKSKNKCTRRAPRFSSSWSVVETPRSTELTPSLRRHQAWKKRENQWIWISATT